MYKMRLQEVCQQRLWAMPQYTSSREGPDHNPSFRASVAVDGRSFDAPDPSKSSKEAQNKAAQVALDHFAATLPPAAPSPPPTTGQISYKNQLLNYLQRKNIEPMYGCVREGPPHALRFKATVAFDGQTFESPQFFSTLREAELAASKVALMDLPPEENQQEDPGFYKNLLQELAQKEGFFLPVYKTTRDGASHMPIFSSTVEIEGEIFEGHIAKTKRQAEMNAAKVAWCKLKERKARKVTAVLSSRFEVEKDLEPVSPPSEVILNPQQPRSSSVRASWVVKKDEGEVIADKAPLNAVNLAPSLPDDHGTRSSGVLVDNDSTLASQLATFLHKPIPQVTTVKVDTMGPTSSEGGTSSICVPSGSDRHAADSDSEVSGASCSILCNKVRVYPRKPDMVLPEGATLLPFSDDKWVAVSLDFSNHEGGVMV